jgi:hypothetical protein
MSQVGRPATGFRPFFNPATGEWITYTAIAEDNHGQLVRFTWRSVPGGVITEHIHPRHEEGGAAAVISCADKTCSDWPFPLTAQ